MLVLGGTLGLVAGAGAAAYAATRKDGVGDAARGVGNCAMTGANKAKELNDEHNITGKATAAAQAGIAKAKEVNEKHGITEKITAGVSKVTEKAKEIEEKHNV